ncbi:MAG TPA: cell division protein ZipA C-terminal FtsZ-binding domain-containing protein [Burkholderiales bacterium]|nr:cell division protein ZipA C-terminal FtsZ-binding domain-containing protein [Burkholderiales bacterium]
MSDLQISLLAIGALVVVGVFLYNWIQERRFRRRLSEAFGEKAEDVLLEDDAGVLPGEARQEPQLEPSVEFSTSPVTASDVPPSPSVASPGPRRARDPGAALEFDAVLEGIAEIRADRAIQEGVIGELMSKLAACGKPARATGFNAETGTWEPLDRGAGTRYTALRIGLQLVNRAGPVNPAQLAMFSEAVTSAADKLHGQASMPAAQALLQAARDLDAFCATVDVAIGVNVIAAEGAAFSGTKIRALAEAAGFKLEPDGVFHFRDEHRQTLFTLDNHEPAPFLPEQIKTLSTGGITMLLDVPRVADGLDVLDRMVDIARGLASALGGQLVDDNRVELSEAGVARIGQQLSFIRSAMARKGIPAGSTRALRLFS